MPKFFTAVATLACCAACGLTPQGDTTGTRTVSSPGAPTVPSTPTVSVTNPNGPADSNTLPAPAFACPAGPFAASPLPAAGATITLLATPPGMEDWSEGPVWVASAQHLLFSAAVLAHSDGHGPPTTIYQLAWPNTLSVFSPTGMMRTNGMALALNGDIYAAVHDTRSVARLPGAVLSQRMDVVSTFNGESFDSPNDLTLRNDGNIYFVDPDYQADNRALQPNTRVYRLAPNGQLTVVDATRDEPNGIALSLDQNSLLIGGHDHLIKRYAIAADGSTGPAMPWASTPANVDGMAVDCAGNVYATLTESKAIAVYAPDGTLLGTLPSPATPSNLAFGGPDQRTLFITGEGKLFTLAMPIPGLPY